MDTIDNSLHAKALFGGAISIMLPTRLADVSDFRPVPDNQEVLADGATDQSIVVEIMEHTEEATAESSAAEYYYRDLRKAMESRDLSNDFAQSLGPKDLPGMPENANMSMVVGKQSISKGRQDGDASNIIQIALVVVQLPDVKSDIVLTQYTPLFINPRSAAAKDAGPGIRDQREGEEALKLLRAIIRSLQIHDWGLFG